MFLLGIIAFSFCLFLNYLTYIYIYIYQAWLTGSEARRQQLEEQLEVMVTNLHCPQMMFAPQWQSSILRDLGFALVSRLSGQSAQVLNHLTYHWLGMSGDISGNPQISDFFFHSEILKLYPLKKFLTFRDITKRGSFHQCF